MVLIDESAFLFFFLYSYVPMFLSIWMKTLLLLLLLFFFFFFGDNLILPTHTHSSPCNVH
jgi:hypothetical protein